MAESNFRINGVVIPTPSTYEFDVEDLSSEETGRTLDGVMHKDVVAVKDTYTCTWNKLSWEDTAKLLNAINAKSKFDFTYVDPRKPNKWLTNKFYVGARTGAALNITDPERTWSKISFKFIRV